MCVSDHRALIQGREKIVQGSDWLALSRLNGKPFKLLGIWEVIHHYSD